MNDQQTDEFAIAKTVRLIDYLQRIATLRTKLIRDVKEYERTLWLADIPEARGCFTQAGGRDEDYDPEEWIVVENRREPELPNVPARCHDWLVRSTLRDKQDLPELLPEITRQIENPDWSEDSDLPEYISHAEVLEDNPEVQQEWDRYLEAKWLLWKDSHDEWEKIHKVYSTLFSFHQELLRLGENYELVLALGLLTWRTNSGQRVRRHLLVADAVLEFEAQLGKFTVRPHTEGANLRPEFDMLDIEDLPPLAEETAKTALSDAEDDPWEVECIEKMLLTLVHSISSEGAYEESLSPQLTSAAEKPIVERAPAIILRKRSSKGLTETLKQIKDQIKKGGEIPGEFRDIGEIRPESNRLSGDDSTSGNTVFDGEVFFPKPSNDEQRRITEKIRTSNGVLVQGPPGTGKSHTIANLICHLLATGQRILVTAKTPRALQVLEGLVPEELQPLCINLLGSGAEERRSLESSVGGILRKFEDWKQDRADLEITKLEDRLQELREEKAKVNRRLRDIRESETHSQTIAGGQYRGTAARIAEAVSKNRDDFDWFKDSADSSGDCPVLASELLELVNSLRRFPSVKREELGQAWPRELQTSEAFARQVRKEEITHIEEEESTGGADEKIAKVISSCEIESIAAILDSLREFRDALRKLKADHHSWMGDALRDVLIGDLSSWQAILRETKNSVEVVEKEASLADKTNVEFPVAIDIGALAEDARKLKEHLRKGGKLGWGILRPKLVRERLDVVKTVRLSGRPCSTMKHFATVEKVLNVRISCEKAWSLWSDRVEKPGTPYAIQAATLKSFAESLENALQLEELIGKSRDALDRCPSLDEPIWSDAAQVECYIHSAQLAQSRVHSRDALEEIQSLEAPISSIANGTNPHPVANALLVAIRERDAESFSHCAARIQELEQSRNLLQQLEDKLCRLRTSLPRLVENLVLTCNEEHWETRAHGVEDAWRWAQARYWIEDYIQQEDASALESRANQIEDESNGIVAKLASLHAWSICFKRLKEEHRRHMEAWQQAMKRLGKGTGTHAARHRREAQLHLNECREAVPAWVMPLHRVWDTIAPAPGMFDVIIVDEASQCGLEALPLLYLAKKILIVGDDKQISPDAVGLKQDVVHRLMEELLYDFEFKSSFDIQSSLFDHGKLRYGTQRITLREHFRCMPEIIRFSNDLCYSDTPLIPLRQYPPDRLPPLERVFVEEGYREGTDNRTINRPEAEHIVDRIIAIVEDERYNGKSIGVVVLQGEAQARLIEDLLLKRLGAEEMERRRLVCGNPYSFQGDERDIILLSLVAASNKRIGPFAKADHERRFNVAASRARDSMVLFHSVSRDELSSTCVRRRLLEFFEDTRPQQIAGIDRNELEHRAVQDNRMIVEPPPPFDSWFELDVALELARKNYHVIPQYEVAGRRIDFVVEGGRARLAVECDGDKWHGPDRFEADTHRQRQLERCGWEFCRVRESSFYANKDAALQDLWRQLEERGITPTNLAVTESHTLPRAEDCDGTESEAVERLEDVADGDDASMGRKNDEGASPSRRAEQVAAAEISEAILKAMSARPNLSCTVRSITSRVLKEVGVLTRGKPREQFESRVMQCINQLEKRGRLEKYKAKNDRIRLVQ